MHSKEKKEKKIPVFPWVTYRKCIRFFFIFFFLTRTRGERKPPNEIMVRSLELRKMRILSEYEKPQSTKHCHNQ